MVWLALVLAVAFLGAAFGYRTWHQWRRTGDAGWRLGRPHSPAEAVARASMVVAGVLVGVAVGVAFDGEVESGAVAVVGAVVAVTAIALALVAQLQMGASWRIGVDPDERTELVTGGVYRHVRNPIYTGMSAFTIGEALLVPSWWSIAAAVLMTVGVEVQVRGVEEPYLRTVHGDAFAGWARRTGRFVPGLGGA